MKINDLVEIKLQFPSKRKFETHYELTAFFKSFLYDVHDIFVKDGYDGKDDGLIEFRVTYNDFHKMYTFSLCGGTRYKEKTMEIRNLFISMGYEVSNPEHTWVTEFHGRPRADGQRFWVRQQNNG
jgi:hypothetical protein